MGSKSAIQSGPVVGFVVPRRALAPSILLDPREYLYVAGEAGLDTALLLPPRSMGPASWIVYVAFVGTGVRVYAADGDTVNGGASVALSQPAGFYTVTTGATEWVVQLLVGSSLTSAWTPPAHAGTHKDGGTDEVATLTAAAGAIPKAQSDWRLPDRFMRPSHYTRRHYQWSHDQGLITVSATGTLATLQQINGVTDAIATNEIATGIFEQDSTSALANDFTGRISSATVTRRAWNPVLVQRIRIGNSLSGVRYWFGLTNAALDQIATPTTEQIAAFRYDVGVDGTVFWRCVTCDGTTVGTTITPVAMSTLTVYVLRIEVDDATPEIRFYINDVQVASHGVFLPAQLTDLKVWQSLTTLSAIIRRFLWDFTSLSQI